MTRVLGFIDSLPLATLVMASILLGLAPLFPEPHLVEKTRWLMEGHPFKLIDVFDVLMHGAPLVLLAVRLARMRKAA